MGTIITSFKELKKVFRSQPRLLVGFLSYELGYQFLGIKPREKPGPNLPEIFFTLADKRQANTSEASTERKRGFRGISLGLTTRHRGPPQDGAKNKNLYLQKIHLIKEKLRAGETYQVNFSQRFAVPVPLTAFPDFYVASRAAFRAADFFQKLSHVNPTPHPFFLETDDFAVISNSPELLVRGWRDGDKFFIETRPMKGTAPRGRDAAEDAEKISQLLASKKDEAELTMIVDLERNDLGRVCKPGTIRVIEHRRVEKYSHVIHTISVIRGELEEGKDVFDVLEALFPGGSITGCPKKRTMEIIDELEDFQRGVYCGSAGYIAEDGSFEFNIMIRTAFLDKRTGVLSFNSGGGIVIDSDPEKEYEETLHKAAAFFQALYSLSQSTSGIVTRKPTARCRAS